MKERFKGFCPPGSGYDVLIIRFMKVGFILSALLSQAGWISFLKYGKRFSEVTYMDPVFVFNIYFNDRTQWGFNICILAALCFVIPNILYLTCNSKAIYLVKRLPNRFELWKETIVLPIVVALIIWIGKIIVLTTELGIFTLVVKLFTEGRVVYSFWYIIF